MAVKKRPRAAREALAQQAAATRRNAPGRRFVGDAREQSERARREERARVTRMAEIDRAVRRAASLTMPLTVVFAELVDDSVRLARTLVAAPFRIANALRAMWRPREA